MLYITTRSKKETYTSYKALISEAAPDGGRYYPFKMPVFSGEQILKLRDKQFNEIVADVLNAFFSSRLTGWDIDFCIGKNSVRVVSLNYKVLLTELWHNPKGLYAYIEERIYARLLGKETDGRTPDWVRIAVRIAVLFGIYGQLCAEGHIKNGTMLDVAVLGVDFEAPMAAFYARQMGLPVNTVLCTCSDESNIWEFLHRGSFSVASASESLRGGIERLVSASLGTDALNAYLDCCKRNRSFTVPAECASALSDGFFCTVAGKDRAGSIVNSVYRSCDYVMDPVSALCYGGIQDYRSAKRNSCLTLMISEHSPVGYMDEIVKATGMPEQKLLEQVKR